MNDVALGPYLRLAAVLRRRVGLDSDLRSEQREILDALHTGTSQTKGKARERMLKLSEPGYFGAKSPMSDGATAL